jgi:hypothetical protein
MFTVASELKGYFEYDALGLYLRAHEIAEIDGVVVDVANILGRRFLCDGLCCLRSPDSACSAGQQAAATGDCCQEPWVPLSTEEQDRIAQHLEGILAYMTPEAQALVKGQLARGKESRTTFCHPVRSQEGRDLGVTALKLIRRNCIFRALGRDGDKWQSRCAIHGYCLAKSLAPWEVKPLYCWLWPLTIVPLYDGRFLLTVHNRENYQFTQEQKTRAAKPCLAAPSSSGLWLYQVFASELKHIFGESFYQALSTLAAQKLEANGETYKCSSDPCPA